MTHFSDKPLSVYGMDFLAMQIDHIHFYVKDLAARRDWFVQKMGCQTVSSTANCHTATEVLKSGAVYFVLSSALSLDSPVASYLSKHPSGVADVALRVSEIEKQLLKADQIQMPMQSIPQFEGTLKWAKISGWGSLSHTLIENTSSVDFCRAFFDPDPHADFNQEANGMTDLSFTHIDHVVLNVPAGALAQAVNWYKNLFDFKVQQAFEIQTEKSGLNSKVLRSRSGEVYFNINEPSSSQSQIQEFLDENGGSGIQHIALKTSDIVQAVIKMRECGMEFLSVPSAYYSQLKQRLQQLKVSQFLPQEIQEIESQHILMDWQKHLPESTLLQIFSHPIFEQRTFFLS
jgi:4-hydroxyphenylpyruvate dioxygenase